MEVNSWISDESEMSNKDSRTGRLPYATSNKNHLYLYSESLEEKYL